MAGANPVAQVLSSRHSNKVIDAAVEEALALTGTAWLADAQAGLLPLGQRRLVELARALAGPFDMLLLDEPSSGLDGHETEQFGEVLRTVVRERQCGILLVEHDMNLVREICDYIYVLEFGQLIFEGTAEQMQNSAQVRAAYLGDFDLVEAADPEAVAGGQPGDSGARRPIVTRD
jgi:ABC-type branched-subunit amino acid transport system ATPase component